MVCCCNLGFFFVVVKKYKNPPLIQLKEAYLLLCWVGFVVVANVVLVQGVDLKGRRVVVEVVVEGGGVVRVVEFVTMSVPLVVAVVFEFVVSYVFVLSCTGFVVSVVGFAELVVGYVHFLVPQISIEPTLRRKMRTMLHIQYNILF